MRKEIVFVQHIQDHLDKMSPEQKGHGKVMCKICNKTIDEIYYEETHKKDHIYTARDAYQLNKTYIDRNGKTFQVVEVDENDNIRK